MNANNRNYKPVPRYLPARIDKCYVGTLADPVETLARKIYERVLLAQRKTYAVIITDDEVVYAVAHVHPAQEWFFRNMPQCVVGVYTRDMDEYALVTDIMEHAKS